MRMLMVVRESKNAEESMSADASGHGRSIAVWIIVVGTVLFFGVFPRFLVNVLGETNPWTSYFYLYGNGLIVFLIGVGVILRSGACRWGRGWDTFWFVVLCLGYVFFAVLHAAWVWAALHIPLRGGM